jgi:phenylacetic acid degradation operon negative regulatory protein
VLASFSVPETRRNDRNRIRGGLLKIGFGSVGPGLCIAREHLRKEAARYIDQNRLGEFVEFFVSEHAGPGSLKQKVSQWWDLDALEHNYAKFVDGHTQVLELWRGCDAPEDPREAFRTYIPMVTEWRRLPFLDPGLPADLLPSGWQGENARVLFVELNALLAPLSAQHAQRAIHVDR